MRPWSPDNPENLLAAQLVSVSTEKMPIIIKYVNGLSEYA